MSILSDIHPYAQGTTGEMVAFPGRYVCREYRWVVVKLDPFATFPDYQSKAVTWVLIGS